MKKIIIRKGDIELCKLTNDIAKEMARLGDNPNVLKCVSDNFPNPYTYEKAIEFIQVSTPHFNNRPLHSFSKKYKSENNFGVCAFNDFYSSSFSRVSNTGTLHSGTSLFDSFSNPKPIWSDLEIEITSFDYDCTKSISMLEKSVGLNLDIHSDYISDLSEFEWKIAKIENSLKNQIL